MPPLEQDDRYWEDRTLHVVGGFTLTRLVPAGQRIGLILEPMVMTEAGP